MKQYTIGTPFETGAVIEEVQHCSGFPPFGESRVEDGRYTLRIPLEKEDRVYGLGESMRGINKRGFEYFSNNTDHGDHTETARYLYSSHNFLLIDGSRKIGLFIDSPDSSVQFDIGYTDPDLLEIHAPAQLNVYVIEGETALEIIQAFRKAIGRSYLPPKYAFGYAQSRFEYRTREEIRQIADRFDAMEIPLDLINLDLDYMQDNRDFTLSAEFAGSFAEFVQEMKERQIHLVPIIDAGIAFDPEDPVYCSGHAADAFVKDAEGREFIGAVWPGKVVFPDFLNSESAAWFGKQFEMLTEKGIDSFWLDMNEPAIFYSPGRLEEAKKSIEAFGKEGLEGIHFFRFLFALHALQNSPEDFSSFYHKTAQGTVRHDTVHNLYGMYMSKAVKEGLDGQLKRRPMLFSRSSYIGAHRYAGLWTGDNSSWWSHLELIFHQLPGLNMAGFLYTGCDLGGFAQDCTEDLMLRFHQLGIFLPLLRNHSSRGCRPQEPYRWKHPEQIAFFLSLRYRLLPYLYSEYLKAVEHNRLLFTPPAFLFPEDDRVKDMEDQLFFGEEVMLAPVFRQNAAGRMVYLPEEMMKVTISLAEIRTELLAPGDHYVLYPLDEEIFFLRKNTCIPLAEKALRTGEIDWENLQLIGYTGAVYELYDDDGISFDACVEKRKLSM